MEGYEVVSIDDHKVGRAVGTHNGFLIVESGMLRKKKHAVPLDAARPDADEEVVRLTLTKEMVEEGPAVDDDDADWQAVTDYYGRTSELEGQTAGIPPADQERAEMRESLQTPDVEKGPPKGAVGIHQDRWEVKED
jgi:hypothetical protein